MTAPTPERRVGEARCLPEMVVGLAQWSDAEVAALPVLGHRARDLALDLLDERAAVVRLTAEVERLTWEAGELREIVKQMAPALGPEWVTLTARLVAALSLPTPAPEAQR